MVSGSSSPALPVIPADSSCTHLTVPWCTRGAESEHIINSQGPTTLAAAGILLENWSHFLPISLLGKYDPLVDKNIQ